MKTPTSARIDPQTAGGRVIDITDLAARIRWRRYFLAAAAANPYLESPAYAA